jgi:hypothetical protein
MIFHKHNFQPLPSNEKRLYCSCGERRCIHEWEQIGEIKKGTIFGNVHTLIRVLRCKNCGEMSNHEV